MRCWRPGCRSCSPDTTRWSSRGRRSRRLARGVTARAYLLRGAAKCGFLRACLVPARRELSGVIAEMDGAVKQVAAYVISR